VKNLFSAAPLTCRNARARRTECDVTYGEENGYSHRDCTPVRMMEETAAIPPLGLRRDAKVMIQAEKFKCLPDHPMKKRMENLTKNRLKRSSFVHESKRLARLHQATIPPTTQPIDPTTLLPQPWTEESPNLQVHTTVPYLSAGDLQDDVVKRTLTQAMIAERYPDESWIHVYTDGSATNAVKNGGAGIHISTPQGDTDSAAVPTGKYCSNYSAEVQALMLAADMVLKLSSSTTQVVFLTDALSALEALAGDKLQQLTLKLQAVASAKRVVLQWIPAHCGIPGNEAADQLAKQGAQGRQPDNSVSFVEKRTLVKAAMRQNSTRDDYHLLERAQQVIIMRLRTGHCRLNAHMFHKLKLTPSPTCPCGLEDQTPEHVLQSCPLLNQLRQTIWPVDTPLNTKLYGCGTDLQDTTSFVSQAGLTL